MESLRFALVCIDTFQKQSDKKNKKAGWKKGGKSVKEVMTTFSVGMALEDLHAHFIEYSADVEQSIGIVHRRNLFERRRSAGYIADQKVLACNGKAFFFLVVFCWLLDRD